MQAFLTALAAHGFELLSAIGVSVITAWGTLAVARIKLKADVSKAAADSYENRHDKLMLAEAQDKQTFRRQLLTRVELLERRLLDCTTAHAEANQVIAQQQRDITELQHDLDRVVGRVNEIGRQSQFADMHDIEGLRPKASPP